jgi:hypothetical protein
MARTDAARSSSAGNDRNKHSDTVKHGHGFRSSRRGTPMQVKTDNQKK